MSVIPFLHIYIYIYNYFFIKIICFCVLKKKSYIIYGNEKKKKKGTELYIEKAQQIVLDRKKITHKTFNKRYSINIQWQ